MSLILQYTFKAQNLLNLELPFNADISICKGGTKSLDLSVFVLIFSVFVFVFTFPWTALPSPLHFRKTRSQLRLLSFRTLKSQKFLSNSICRIQNVFLSKIKITSDPIAMEEEDNCLGSLLNSSHCTLVADSTLLVTPANTRLASDRRHSLIFTRTGGSGGCSTIGQFLFWSTSIAHLTLATLGFRNLQNSTKIFAKHLIVAQNVTFLQNDQCNHLSHPFLFQLSRPFSLKSFPADSSIFFGGHCSTDDRRTDALGREAFTLGRVSVTC